MNILPHKSWHVRTKKNIHRVQRDEAKAAEEEKRQLERQLQAENERRINVLRQKADDRISTMFGSIASTSERKDVAISDETGHVNLFQDLEREERKNLGNGNKEYEKEKEAEKREWESKMGIQVYFADGTNDLDKKKEWYEQLPMRTSSALKRKPVAYDIEYRKEQKKDIGEDNEEERKKRKKERDSEDDEEEKKDRKKKSKKDKKKKKKKHRHHSDDEEAIEEDYKKEKQKKLQELRDERLRRERTEAARTYALLHPETVRRKEEEKKPKYNSQFNPDFARK